MSDNDESRGSKYPPPHPVFLQEHQEALNELRAARAELIGLREKLFTATVALDKLRREASGGPTDPWSDINHHGHILFLLGWEHTTDEYGLCWKDPVVDKGKTIRRTLTEALNCACLRLIDRQSSIPTSFARLTRDDDEV